MTLKYSQFQPPNQYLSNRESRSVLKERLINLQKTNDHNIKNIMGITNKLINLFKG